MPPQNGVWLNNLGQSEQARPEPCHPHQQRPITTPQPKTWRSSPQGGIELMTKKEVLGLKLAPRLEQIGDNRPKQLEVCEHRDG
jgi:hypothetical protein